MLPDPAEQWGRHANYFGQANATVRDFCHLINKAIDTKILIKW